jgi:N-acetylglutamate synthase-like GNAT family acetyltransferase
MRGEVMLAVECAQKSGQEWQIAPQFGSLPNGMNVTIRRAKVSDAHRIKEMHQRLSKETIFSRYLHPYMPTLEDLQKLCSLEEEEGFVLVATIEEPEEKVVGITCFYVEPQNPTSAEPAILVEDEYQGRGLGKQLIQNLGHYASKIGVSEFTCYTHLNNERVLGMIKGSGLRFESKYDQGMRVVRVWLNPNT